MVTEVQNRNTRQFNDNNVHVPRVGIEKTKSAFSYSGPIVWNSLPDDIKECTCIKDFKRKAQQYFINVVHIYMYYVFCVYVDRASLENRFYLN